MPPRDEQGPERGEDEKARVVLFGVAVAAGITTAIAAWFTWFWYGLPVSRALADRRSRDSS